MAAVLTVALAGACTSPSGKLVVDAPKLLPYQPPDIDEITGIDSEEAEEEAAAQKPQK